MNDPRKYPILVHVLIIYNTFWFLSMPVSLLGMHYLPNSRKFFPLGLRVGEGVIIGSMVVLLLGTLGLITRSRILGLYVLLLGYVAIVSIDCLAIYKSYMFFSQSFSYWFTRVASVAVDLSPLIVLLLIKDHFALVEKQSVA